MHCKKREDCPAFLEEQAKHKALTSFTPEWFKLAKKLDDLKCDEEENGVCCK